MGHKIADHASGVRVGGRADLVATWHGRVRELGLKVDERPQFNGVSRPELSRQLERHHLLYSHALPVMQTLREQIRNTHTMLVLTDQDGLILHSIGDDDFLAEAASVALRTGVNWSERNMGTNAIGTALRDRSATLVHAEEHYLLANRGLTCSCSPIFDPRGQLLGALDVSGPESSYHAHTLGLVRMSTQLIENQLFAASFDQAIRLHFHARPEFVGTLMEGIAAFADDGTLLALNRGAQLQLGLGGGEPWHGRGSIRGQFGLALDSLIERARASGAGLLKLRLPSGALVHARVALGARHSPILVPGGTAVATPARARATPGALRLEDLDTGDAAMSALIARLRRVHHHDIAVLLQGETGTGKELLARALHNESARRDKPFVAVDCACIPESLIEAELFGYEDGAFTGARKHGNPGKILSADGGTLFLDEIGDMPLAMQARLLRVLQEREVLPLGGHRGVAIDVQVVAATHRDLPQLIAQHKFREDLYYRLNGLTVTLPPLRRRTDLAALIARILERQGEGPDAGMSAEVLALFERSAWPGNVRQLTNVLRVARIMAGARPIEREDLPEDFLAHVQAEPEGESLRGVHAAAVTDTLARCQGNVAAAARALRVSRNTIYRALRPTRLPRDA